MSRSTGRARATNAARRKRQRAIQVVATHPAGELSKTIKQDVDQNVNTSSKRSTAESRFMKALVLVDIVMELTEFLAGKILAINKLVCNF